VLFNRFFQPDIDPVRAEPTWHLTLTDSSELSLRLQWIAVLAGRIRPSLAITGGVRDAIDAVKSSWRAPMRCRSCRRSSPSDRRG
jgi:dihydroorotate dehydrogenase (fumarate)